MQKKEKLYIYCPNCGKLLSATLKDEVIIYKCGNCGVKVERLIMSRRTNRLTVYAAFN